MRIVSTSRTIFAVTMIGLGIIGLLHHNLVSLWNPPTNSSAGSLLVAFSSLISLAAGFGLLFRRIAGIAARLLLATFLVWLLLFRLPNFLRLPAFAACWSVFPLAVMLAAAWVLYVWFATDWDRKYLGFVIGGNGLRIAHTLYGLCLIFFGSAHFIDLKDTLSLIPHWLPAHLFWAYFTGCAFIAAGVAALTGIWARLAVTLSVLQLTLFLVLVWVPIVATGSRNPFQWSETILNAALAAGAWVVAESYSRKSVVSQQQQVDQQL
ncbi:MAG TPA: hypothetical protein VFU55_08425 [Terracidiphilus sp.]|nr:hypothetical protein [Terracidiphilus sp.]